MAILSTLSAKRNYFLRKTLPYNKRKMRTFCELCVAIRDYDMVQYSFFVESCDYKFYLFLSLNTLLVLPENASLSGDQCSFCR